MSGSREEMDSASSIIAEKYVFVDLFCNINGKQVRREVNLIA